MPRLEDHTDEDLAASLARGQQEALGELFARYQLPLRGWIGRHVHAPEEVADILQDTFVDVLRGIGSYDPARPFGPWLRTVCRYRLYKYLRTVSVRRTRAQMLVDEALAEVGVTDSNDELIPILRDCLAQLGNEQRALVEARYGEGETYADLAERFGKRENTVMVILSRIRSVLRRCVDIKRKAS
jgi:RNA polymerase sigma factor (sigma-70 family)